jgi:hypothetical protein
LTERDETLTTSELANQPSDDADAPMARDQQTDEIGERHEADGRPNDDATHRAETEQAIMPLLSSDRTSDFDRRWGEIQTAFVDEPRESVQRADQLVAELMQNLASSFAETRTGLERQWDRGDDVSTEDLRLALTRYRSFFQRLLAA